MAERTHLAVEGSRSTDDCDHRRMTLCPNEAAEKVKFIYVASRIDYQYALTESDLSPPTIARRYYVFIKTCHRYLAVRVNYFSRCIVRLNR